MSRFYCPMMVMGVMAVGAWTFAQNGAPAGSSAPGPSQSIPSGAAPVPGATNPATTPMLPLTSPQPYPALPVDRAPASVDSFQQTSPPVLTWPLWQPRPDPNVQEPAPVSPIPQESR
ncbi:MAG: hypothetical protein KF789_12955 [Bdellovibrionaceae bacterium]|nr:hypothetical protein [Pseudobdellovibrionaceae bacterium]